MISYTSMMDSVKSGTLFNSLSTGMEDLGAALGPIKDLGAGLTTTPIPGFDLDMSSISKKIMSVASTATSSVIDQAKNLGTSLPLVLSAQNQQQFVARVDQIASNDITTPTTPVNDAIMSAFPGDLDAAGTEGAGNGCLGGGSFMDAFKPILEGPKTILKAISDIKAMITSQLSGLSSALNAVRNAASDVFQQALQGLKTAASGIFGSVKDQFGKVTDGIQGLMNKLKSDITGMVATAKSALSDALATVKAGAFMRLFDNKSACVNQVMNVIRGGGKIDTRTVEIAKNNADIYKVPAVEAVATVQSGLPMADVDTSPAKPIPKTNTAPQYSQQELENMRTALKAFNALLEKNKRNAALWLKVNVEEWKASVSYEAKRDASNAEGHTEAATAAFLAVQEEYTPKKLHYNENIVPPINAQEREYKAMYNEYQNRLAFGKTPYTTKLELYGQATPTDKQYTFLDSGV